MSMHIVSPDASVEGADWIKTSPGARAERSSVDLSLGGVEASLDALEDELRRHGLPVPRGIKRPSFRSVMRAMDAPGLRITIVPGAGLNGRP